MNSAPPTAIHEPVKRRELERFFNGVAVSLEQSNRLTVSEMGKFFSVIQNEIEPQQRARDRKHATRFNVFDFIRPDENRLSDVLAWLLNPQASHGQSDRFLRLFFKKLGLSSEPSLLAKATVRREAPTYDIQKYRRRMDVLVKAGALLAIENKVDSGEQDEQVKDYLEHLSRCSGGKKAVLVYLTPDERLPESLTDAERQAQVEAGNLQCWSYQSKLLGWVEDCHRECEAQKIRIFLEDFIGYIKTELKRDEENSL